MRKSNMKFEKLFNHNEINEEFKRIITLFCKENSSVEDIKKLLKKTIEESYNVPIFFFADGLDNQKKDNDFEICDDDLKDFKNKVWVSVFNYLATCINSDLNTDIFFYLNDKGDFTCSLGNNDDKDEQDEEDYVNIIKEWAKEKQYVDKILNVKKILMHWKAYKESEELVKNF